MMTICRLIIVAFFFTIGALLLVSDLPFLLVISVSCFAAVTVGRLATWLQGRRDARR